MEQGQSERQHAEHLEQLAKPGVGIACASEQGYLQQLEQAGDGCRES